MKGKPLLVAVAAFVIVLIGGAAMAGIGIQRDNNAQDTSAYGNTEHEPETTAKEPEPTSKTTAIAPRPEAEKKEEPAESREKEAEKATHEEEEPEKLKKEADDLEVVEIHDPAFTIDYPVEGSNVKSKVAAFGGTFSDGTSIHRGKYEAAQHEGEWSMELVLSPGRNRVAFEGLNGSGEPVVATVTVYYNAPEKEIVKEEPKEEAKEGEKELEEGSDHENVIFKAHQKYGSCGEEVPYDVFYGSGKPGVKISASSEYGSNSTIANDDGQWEMKVTFPEAPSGKTFNVKIRASTGESQTFSFTNTGGGEDH